LEERGITREQALAYVDAARAKEARSETLDFDPLEAISSKLDKLQESVDALAAKLDRE
jgi:hypothetical protein